MYVKEFCKLESKYEPSVYPFKLWNWHGNATDDRYCTWLLFWEQLWGRSMRWWGKESQAQRAKHAPAINHRPCSTLVFGDVSGHLSSTPFDTAASIFRPMRTLTRHELLSGQPHGNHAQIVHGGGPGCGICHGHVEPGCVHRYTPQTIGGCRKNRWLTVNRQGCLF